MADAPTAPEKVRRVILTSDNFPRVWPAIMHRAALVNLNLGVWLSQAVFGGIEENTLILRFGSDQKKARSLVDKAENRRALETALVEMTSNLKVFRTELSSGNAEMPVLPEKEDVLPRYASANPDDVRAVMENPQVAKILDVFKGRVVEVKFGASAAAESRE